MTFPKAMAANEPEPHKSALALAIEARPRKSFEFDLGGLGFFGPGDKEVAKVAIRVAVKAEEHQAINAAHAYAAQAMATDAAKTDKDFLDEEKTIQILYIVCRDPANETYSAFLSPKWMREHFTADQSALLLNLYNEAKRQSQPVPPEIGDDTLETWLRIAADHANSDVPAAALAAFDRETLSQMFVMAALKVREARSPTPADDAADVVEPS